MANILDQFGSVKSSHNPTDLTNVKHSKRSTRQTLGPSMYYYEKGIIKGKRNFKMNYISHAMTF